MVKIEYLIFDWGNTIMRDFSMPGPMKDWENVATIEGVDAVLEQLHKSYTLIIATSADHSNTEDMIAALQRVGAEKYFSYFFSSKDLGAAKPSHEFFEKILEEVGCEADKTISIGDRYLNDVVAAKRAGIHTIWFNEKLKVCDAVEADAIIHHMSDLPQAIAAL